VAAVWTLIQEGSELFLAPSIALIKIAASQVESKMVSRREHSLWKKWSSYKFLQIIFPTDCPRQRLLPRSIL